MANAIELVRVSTALQAGDDRASIPAQHTINARTAAAHGLKIVRSVNIVDVSGASVLQSPQMQELLRLIQDPEIAGVVCREFSRVMRPDSYEDLVLLQKFADSATKIYMPGTVVDPSDQLVTLVHAGMAGRERREMLAKSWASKEHKRRKGELAQSKIVLPWGVDYALENGQPVWSYKPVEAAKVQAAYKAVLAGDVNYSRFAKEFGVTPRGAALVLRNPIWMGWRILDKKRNPTSAGKYTRPDGRQSDRRKMQRAADDVIRVQVIQPGLLSEADWQRAQQIMQAKEQLHWRNRKDRVPRFTYAGFLVCAVCGAPVHTCKSRRDYYACSASRIGHTCTTKYMARAKLEALLDTIMAARLTSRKFLADCVRQLQAQQRQGNTTAQLPALQRTAAKLARQREQVVDMFLEGTIAQPERDKRLAKLDADIAAAQQAITAITAAVPAQLQASELVKRLAPLARWKTLDYDGKRAVMGTLGLRVQIADYQIKAVGFSSFDTRALAGISITVVASAIAPPR